jgi:hypothetical protein
LAADMPFEYGKLGCGSSEDWISYLKPGCN